MFKGLFGPNVAAELEDVELVDPHVTYPRPGQKVQILHGLALRCDVGRPRRLRKAACEHRYLA